MVLGSKANRSRLLDAGAVSASCSDLMAAAAANSSASSCALSDRGGSKHFR